MNQRTVIVTSDPDAQWVQNTTQRMASSGAGPGELYVVDSSQPGPGGEGVGEVIEAVGGGGGGGSDPIRETLTAAVIGGIGSAVGGAIVEAALEE